MKQNITHTHCQYSIKELKERLNKGRQDVTNKNFKSQEKMRQKHNKQ